jgi:hypothetical protein
VCERHAARIEQRRPAIFGDHGDGPPFGHGDDDTMRPVAVDVDRRHRRQVDQLRAPSPVSVSLDLVGGRRVVWGSAEDGDRKATILLALLRRPAQVYDVSTPDVVVTR